MANLSASKKDIKRNYKNYCKNKSVKSAMRTAMRKAEKAVGEHKDFVEDMKCIVVFEGLGMKAAKNNIVSKKSISRKVSKLVQQLKAYKDAKVA